MRFRCSTIAAGLAAYALIAGTFLGAQQPAGAARGIRADMLVTTEWLARRLNDTSLLILHVGDDRKGYDAAHIPGARFVYWSDVAVTREGIPNELPSAEALARLFSTLGVAPGKRVIIYSEDAGLMAARVYVALDYMGAADRAALLDGHWTTWRAEGRLTSSQRPADGQVQFMPRVSTDVVVALSAMRDLVWEANVTERSRLAIIDARPEAEYDGERAGGGVRRPGHIPGATNIFWMRNVVSEENPVMRPVAELRRLYEAAGARPDGLVITYCRTGGQASHAYFTARYLGYDARIYDGSFVEWSRAPDTPVATAGSRR